MSDPITAQPPGEPSPTLEYDRLQAAGTLRASWIRDPDQNCPITPSQLTMQNMTESGWGIQHQKRQSPPDQIYEETVEMGLSGEKLYRKIVLGE